MLTKINKTKARRLFKEGIELIVVPSKMPLDSVWGCSFRVNKEDYIRQNCDDTSNLFDRVMNQIEYYNCNNEMGNYLHYYTEKEEI
jgi:hypothetical protein